MKKTITAAMAAACVLTGAMMQSCGNGSASVNPAQSLTTLLDKNLNSATSFEDTLVAVDGAFIGGFFNTQFAQSQESGTSLNKGEFIRGMKDAMRCDTADMSYIYGFQAGVQVLNTWMKVTEVADVKRDVFLNAVLQALSLDSVNSGELMGVRNQFDMMERQVRERAEQKQKEAAKASKEGQENLMLGTAMENELMGKGDYTKCPNGLLVKVVTPATSEEALQPQQRVMVSYELRHLDGTELTAATQPRMMYVGSASAGPLRDVLQYLKPGETAEVFIPYTIAYGELGNAVAGVGPCESLLGTVTVSLPSEN